MITTDEVKKKYEKIVAWGAGRMFGRYNHAVELAYVVDSDPDKWGDNINGIPVRSPDSLSDESNAVVIISMVEWREAAEEIKKYGEIDFLLPDEIIPNPFPGGIYKKAYTEYGEDVIIAGLINRYKITVDHYIDVGANQPVSGNATFWLYERGITGCLVEPNPRRCGELRKIRPGDVVFECGITDPVHDGQSGIYYDFPELDTRNTFSREIAESATNMGLKCARLDVQMRSLNSIVTEYGKRIDFYNIDVEGYEWNVLRDFDFNRFSGKFFNIEKGDERVKELLERNGYGLISETPSNWIFIQKNIMTR